METRSWRKWWVTLGVLLLLVQTAMPASAVTDLEERVLQAVARHDDREAATLLIEAWRQEAGGAVSPGGVALTEGLSGHYLTAKQLMARVAAEKSSDAKAHLGSLVLVLLEGNPPAGRRAIEDLAARYPENPHLQRRYSDVLESMGLPSAALPRPEEPSEPAEVAAEPVVEPASDDQAAAAPAPAPVVPSPAPSPAAREIRPVQAESVREQLLRQLAEAQTRQAREEALRLQKAKEEQAKKRREEAARLAAEQKRRDEAVRQAAEQKRQQELARQEAERRKAEQARLAKAKDQAAARAAAAQRLTREQQALQQRQAAEAKARSAKLAQEQARQAAEQRKRLERAEQERWLAARRGQPSAPPVQPPTLPSPPGGSESSYVLKPVKIANRRVWVGEERASVHGRLGRPRSVEDGGLERYAGLSVWYDAKGKVATFEVDSAWFHGPGGVRPGLTLREVLRALPNSDGLFHLPASGPDATSSLYVLSTVDGTLAQLQFNDEVWLSTHVRTTTPAGATHLYEELLQKGPVRRLAADYVFALEARKKPLP